MAIINNQYLLRLAGSTLLLVAGAIAQPPGGGAGGGSLGDGIWRRNAGFGEALTFDTCSGHQPGSGQYHYHATPKCLRYELSDNLVVDRTSRTGKIYSEKTSDWTHSPILGWASDGYPIYGPYGYSDPTDATSALKRLKSGYQLRAITQRHSLPDWALGNHSGVSQNLSSSQYGPDVSTKFPLGRYVEDYEWVSGVGDLDQYNGRTTVTPEFPNGTYAYYATIDDDGNATFPYLIAGQLYGSVTGGFSGSASSSASDYFNSGSFSAGPSEASVTSWSTTNWNQFAKIVSGYDPSAGEVTTWPGSNVLSGASTSGSLSTPTYAETQRIRYDSSNVYVNTNGLPVSFGPWFQGSEVGGVFPNFPSNQSILFTIPRTPAAASSKTSSGMGAQGMFVNGTALYNFLDGVSYSNSSGDDPTFSGNNGPLTVSTYAFLSSAVSGEQGPQAPGSLVQASPLWYSVLSASTDSASSADSSTWTTSLGGASISLTDSGGTSYSAKIYSASPTMLQFLMPSGMANGAGTFTITTTNSTYNTVTGKMNIQPSYPSLARVNKNGLASGSLTRVHNGVTTSEQWSTTESDGTVVARPIAINGDTITLSVSGSGLGSATSASATVGGNSATVTSVSTSSGVDTYAITLPSGLDGAGSVDIIVTVAGKPSNAVNVTLQ